MYADEIGLEIIPTPIKRLVKSNELTSIFIKDLSMFVKFEIDEQLIMLYQFPYFSKDSIDNFSVFNTYIGVTTMRIFKIENNNVIQSIKRNDIESIEHEHHILRWDNLCIKLKNKNICKIGIYHAKECSIILNELVLGLNH